MDASFLLVQALNGLASASSLFLTAAGLTIIFGVTRIVNFAHGSLYMLGAYLAVSLAPRLMNAMPPWAGFWVGLLLAALAVGLVGALIEILLLRRIYKAPELFQLLLTFGLVLVFQDLVRLIWGAEEILGPRAPGLKGAVTLVGQRFPTYDLVLIAAGPLVLVLLSVLFRTTRFGILVRAATQDREMVAALGVNEKVLFTSVFFLGATLAGLSGGLQIPREAIHPFLDLGIIVQAFVVTVIGGMGSIVGAFIAALLIGELHAFGILVFPRITLVLIFLVMAVVLVLRPSGLLGRPEILAAQRIAPTRLLRPDPTPVKVAYAAAVILLLFLPLLADAYMLRLATDILIMALFAMSLGFILGTGGIVSFGHAAYLGLGAYGAALVVTHFAWPMELALVAAPVLAGLGALLFGALCVRLAGIYLAMLTLAFAQVVYAVAFQWVEVTGGDNGLIGIWPSAWASSRTAYYYLTLALSLAGMTVLYRAVHAPFGYGLRAVRDSRMRSEAIGIDARRQQWLAFTLSGIAAGLAGGLYAFSLGSIDPSVAAIPVSIDALTMTLLGGIGTVTGPVAGAAALTLLEDWAMPLTDYWRLILGIAIVALVMVFRQGLVGFVEDRLHRHPARGTGPA